MSFISEDQVKGSGGMNLAPMIDFLFLMLVFFASLAVSRVTTRDTDIELVKVKPSNEATLAQDSEDTSKIINLTITEEGKYKWVTEIRDYEMPDAKSLGKELASQYERGLLPEDKFKTQILVKIDKKAKWEPILHAIFAIRDEGFDVHPVYEPEENETLTEEVAMEEETLEGLAL